MITVNDNPLQQFLSEQKSLSILSEFNHTTSCHAIYHSTTSTITPRKPYQRKATITPKQQVFFYYLNLLPTRLISKYHALSFTLQQAIQHSFTHHNPTTTDQALSVLTNSLELTN